MGIFPKLPAMKTVSSFGRIGFVRGWPEKREIPFDFAQAGSSLAGLVGMTHSDLKK
jgi:hypothetical protein